MIPQGNVDTEGGGQGQNFMPAPSAYPPQSDTANTNYALGMGRTWAQQPQQPNGMDYYYQLGQQLLQQQQAMQQQLQQQPMQQQGGGMDSGFDIGSLGPLTANFNHDWLAQRLNAGSANGASITSKGGTPGAGSIPTASTKQLPAGGVSAGWDTPTVKSFGDMKGAGRLM